jgi:hypothetical protein
MMKRFRAELGLTTADLLGLRDRFRAKGMREEA